ncbi:MAG: SET domain-containing protein [Bacteroidetes bacterium]|nr:SET domain-containing protein [Bacteroidota bacterium]
MLIVETYIGPVSGKGIGLFAGQFIPKGSVYWIRDLNFDREFSPDELEALQEPGRTYIQKHGFLQSDGKWYLCGDNARFSNHSDQPNSINQFDDHQRIIKCVAAIDICEGEEITCDYRDTCRTCANGLPFDVFPD